MTLPSTQWSSSPFPSTSHELLTSVSLHYPFNLSCNSASTLTALVHILSPLIRTTSAQPSHCYFKAHLRPALLYGDFSSQNELVPKKKIFPHSIVNVTILLYISCPSCYFLLCPVCYFVYKKAKVMRVTRKCLLNEKINFFWVGGFN